MNESCHPTHPMSTRATRPSGSEIKIFKSVSHVTHTHASCHSYEGVMSLPTPRSTESNADLRKRDRVPPAYCYSINVHVQECPISWLKTMQHFVTFPRKYVKTLQHTATHCNILEHTATHCNTLQHTATLCNTLQQECLISWPKTMRHLLTYSWKWVCWIAPALIYAVQVRVCEEEEGGLGGWV